MPTRQNQTSEEYVKKYGLELEKWVQEDEEYYEEFVYECIACGRETVNNPCHNCGTENPID